MCSHRPEDPLDILRAVQGRQRDADPPAPGRHGREARDADVVAVREQEVCHEVDRLALAQRDEEERNFVLDDDGNSELPAEAVSLRHALREQSLPLDQLRREVEAGGGHRRSEISRP